MNIFKDENGFLKLRAKLLYLEGTNSLKFTIILPYKHIMLAKLIDEHHQFTRLARTHNFGNFTTEILDYERRENGEDDNRKLFEKDAKQKLWKHRSPHFLKIE